MRVAEHSYMRRWSQIDRQSNPDSYVRFMDILRKFDDAAPGLYDETLGRLRLRGGDHVLDVACGTGGAARALIRRFPTVGSVTGADKSTAMLTAALARSRSLASGPRFVLAVGERLPFPDSAFDVSYSIGLFEIAQEPERVLSEMARVTRSGGQIMVGTADSEAIMIESSHHDLTRRIIAFISDVETNGRIGRQLPGLFRDAQLTHVHVTIVPWLIGDFSLLYRLTFADYLRRARHAGALTRQECARWIRDLRARQRSNRFFFCQPLFRVVGRKP